MDCDTSSLTTDNLRGSDEPTDADRKTDDDDARTNGDDLEMIYGAFSLTSFQYDILK